MKKLITLLFGLMFTGLLMGQSPLEFNIENKMNGSYIGNVPLELGTTFILQKFELKAKREQTPGSGGFFSPQDGIDWMIDESSFMAMDWTGYSQTSGWNDAGDKFTLTIGDAWLLLEYNVEIQPFNAGGNVGDPIIGNWNDFNGKERKSEYKAENCSVPFDSTSAEKWKAEAKIKLEDPTDPTPMAIDPSADSLLIVVKDDTDQTVFSYTASIEWVDPSLFGMNIQTSLAPPANGLFYAPTESFDATIVLTNDGGDTLFLNNAATNKVEKVEVWISGPKQNYKNLPDYQKILIVDGYNFQPGSGYDTLTHSMNITLLEALNLEPGTFTILVKAKRKGFGPEIEKYDLTDFQVSTEDETVNFTTMWATTCNNCHDLEKHGATQIPQCVVCHTQTLTKYEFVKIIHQPHATATPSILNCSACHTNSDGNDDASILACSSCHNGDITGGFPDNHATYTDDLCASCHTSGSLSSDEAHSSLTIINPGIISSDIVTMKNFPNPFTTKTTIEIWLTTSTYANLTIYDVNGSKVTTLVNEELQAGKHNFEFATENLPAGIYYCNIKTNEGSKTNKMLLIN